jgi:hypothetical protein
MVGHRLEEVESERDKGVMISNTLKPAAQCARAAGTERTVLGQISKAFHYRDKKVFVKLYMTS